jgi:ABC-type phosphate transport system substrate-binding protein
MQRRLASMGSLRLIGCLVLLLVLVGISGCGGGAGDAYAIEVYTRADACGAADTWALFLDGHKQEELGGTGINSDPGIAQAVIQDKRGIGFNNIGYAYDMDSGLQVSGLRVVPIDVDENGRIDEWEEFYGTKHEVATAIAEGLYPSPPARDLYFVTKNGFSGPAREFVRWVLTDGQQFVDEAGYVRLPDAKIADALAKLGEAQDSLTGTITITGAFALYPMTVQWAEEFRKLHPAVKIDISAGGAGKGMTDALNGLADIGMISRQIYPSEEASGAFWVPVTKDAVVAVVNADNPVLEELLETGMTRQDFVDIWINATLTDWREVTG